MNKFLLLFLLAFALINRSIAKENKTTKQQAAKNPVVNVTGCIPGNAQTDLDINNVRATIRQNGMLWGDSSMNAAYEVPKGSGKHSLFAGSFWISATDAAGNIKEAAQMYMQTGHDFWPGPIDPLTANVTVTTCNAFDKIWKINKQDVINFMTGSPATPDMISYPGNSPYGGNLAPFFDANADGVYNSADGDYPYFDVSGNYANGYNNYLHGDQSLWWVFNDVGDAHTESGCTAMGLEIQAEAYAYSMPGTAIDNTTFYQYTLINRSSSALYNMYFGQFVDPNLGNDSDNYIGCDVIRNLGYCYNGDADDEGLNNYGLYPPAIGLQFLQGPLADANDGIDNNRNGVIDEPGEQIMMSNFMSWYDFSPNSNPVSCLDYRNYLQSTWPNLEVLTYGGDGNNPAISPASYMFPGTTDPSFPTNNWTENTAGHTPGDRRFVMSAGKFTMQPGAVQVITTAVIWARDSSNSRSIDSLQIAADSIQSFFNNRFATTSIFEMNILQAQVAPNPFSNSTTITFNNSNHNAFTIIVFDLSGKQVRTIENITDSKIVILKNDLHQGIYIYQLADKHGNKSAGKLVVE